MRHPRPRAARRLARALLPAFVVALGLGALPAGAHASPSFNWSSTATPAKGGLKAVSCPTESLCVAVDGKGGALSTSNPAGPPSWARATIDGEQSLTAVSCASESLCVAVDGLGNAFVSGAPASASWSPARPIDGNALTGVSCPSASLCVAVDEQGNVLTSTNPAASAWTSTSIDAGHALTAVSCASTQLCVTVDNAGEALSSTNPAGGPSAWRSQRIDFEALRAVSCSPPGICVAVDGAGDALYSNDPGTVNGGNAKASAATWRLTPIDGERLTTVSCAASGVCVAGDGHGAALASDDPGAGEPTWSVSSVDAPNALAGISCLPGGLCMAVDAAGDSAFARVPAPNATTLGPIEVTSSAATLAGAVEPNDAVLSACTFEYGPALPYTQAIPCSSLPTATGGRQAVSAPIAGLAPNTTYHYRVLAISASGEGVGADATFTTAVSSTIPLVTPHPSITGTPAVGQRLTCHAGAPSGSTARLTYAWLRDQIPIPSTDSSTYTVKGQDSGHHLQCEATATTGGGSVPTKSAFVTIPAGGAPASVGETSVGKASFRRAKISVPVSCSPSAGGGCQIALRLTAVETLSGSHVVAVSARAPRVGRAARLRHATVTLASTRAHLPAGVTTTVSAALGATGRRLLAARGHFSAALSVVGTVIGVIESQLSRQLIVLSASSKRGTAATARPLALLAQSRAHASAASEHVLAATPYMGWDTYFALGGEYSEATILTEASQLISLGLEKRGYRYVWLDVGWWHGTRGPGGEITVSPKQWPHGLAWLTRTLHAAGFQVGLYTDAGPDGCGGAGQGSYGHYQQDANTFAAWGFDAVKVDFCGGAEHELNPAAAYSAFHEAIDANSSRRPMLLSICNFLQPEQYGEGRPLLDESAFSSFAFGPSVGNSWRTDTDVGLPGNVPFSDVLRNMDADAAAPQAAGPGHWNDPDYLAPDQGMSATQFRSQLSMWAMLAAPLMISDDLTKIGPASLEAVENTEVIAVDQDPAGVQGTLLSSSGEDEVWVKPLIDGSRAVALLNRGDGASTITTSAGAVGLPHASSYTLRNLWTHTTSATGGRISAQVPGDGTVLLRVSAR